MVSSNNYLSIGVTHVQYWISAVQYDCLSLSVFLACTLLRSYLLDERSSSTSKARLVYNILSAVPCWQIWVLYRDESELVSMSLLCVLLGINLFWQLIVNTLQRVCLALLLAKAQAKVVTTTNPNVIFNVLGVAGAIFIPYKYFELYPIAGVLSSVAKFIILIEVTRRFIEENNNNKKNNNNISAMKDSTSININKNEAVSVLPMTMMTAVATCCDNNNNSNNNSAAGAITNNININNNNINANANDDDDDEDYSSSKSLI